MPLLISIMGPTASGKTELAEALAKVYDAQLINADAFQVYRHLDIGTAKPENRELYQLIDTVDPREQYGVGEFVIQATQILVELWEERRSAVIVGGTGLNIRALTEGYDTMAGPADPSFRAKMNEIHQTQGLGALVEKIKHIAPEVAITIDLSNPARVKRAIERAHFPAVLARAELPPFLSVKFGLLQDASDLEAKIVTRMRAMVQNGWIQEVERLMQSKYSLDDPGLRAIGYRNLWGYVEGKVELEEAIETTIVETRRYAKRQRTWLRSEPNLTVLNFSGEGHLMQVRRHLNTLFV